MSDHSITSHTPGPWEADVDGYVREVKRNAHGYSQPVKTISPWVEGAWNGDEEALANARLIAAAPDLLEAVRQVMGWIDGWDPNFTHDPEWPEVAHYVRAAIQKATGGPDAQ